MAERRMFAKTIVDSDLFLEMPLSTQCLYFHLAMRADDEGFINNPKRIARGIGANEGDIRTLMERGYVIPFETGIVVIRHWKVHNYIRGDRVHHTAFTEEKSRLTEDGNGVYNIGCQVVDKCLPSDGQAVDSWYTEDRLGKDSLGKDSIEKGISAKRTTKFTPPTVEEVKAYCEERKNGIDAQHFIDYYETRGWKVGRNTMKDWKAAVRTWERNESNVRNDKPERNVARAGTENWDWGTVL